MKSLFVILSSLFRPESVGNLWFSVASRLCPVNKVNLKIDSINQNPINLPYGNSSKIYANIFLDDRAGLNESLDRLYRVMYMIRGKKASNLTIGENG
jgi:hypothetical protein